MTAISSMGFYITGGTVPRDAACYVARQADTDLLEGLRQGQFCYVLMARQMGKSSLMVRTATRLRQEGVTCVILDLTAVGQNLDAERWYGGLLNQLGQHVGLEDELDDAWLAPSSLGPMQRWMNCLKEVVLKQRTGNLVIFVDEIDAVRSLPFSADEFFAGIRECYNRRTEDPDFHRLSFCLLGVATPADLIRDTRTTPFNIGTRIELTDFTQAEAAPLAVGLSYLADGEQVYLQLSEAEALLKRALYWTGGHPYLTQRLCSALAEQSVTTRPSDGLVDRLCAEHFLDTSARERDDNLLFVRERLLRSDVDIAGLLLLYRKVWEGKRVPVEETNPLVSLLRLSGIARVKSGLLKPRNRIYSHVFDKRWVAANMPDADVQRQKAAFRAGVYRGAALASVIVLAMGGLTAWALRERQIALQRGIDARIAAKQAEQESSRANRNAALRTSALYTAEAKRIEAEREKMAKEKALGQTRMALAGLSREKRVADRLLYIATMGLIPQHYDRGEFAAMRALLDETKNSPDRGFEWGYWNRLANPAHLTLKGHTRPVLSIAFAPDGRQAVTGSDDRTVRVWDATIGRQILRIGGHQRGVLCAVFSPEGRRVLTASIDKTARIWDAVTGRLLLALPKHPDIVTAAAFSADGRWIATGCGDGSVRVWDAAGRPRRQFPAHSDGVTCLAWSPDGRHLVTGGRDAQVKVWVAETGQAIQTLKGHSGAVTSVGYSADGRRVLTAGEDNIARITYLDAESEPIVLRGHSGWINAAALSADGRRVVTGSMDGTARVWDAENGRQLLIVNANAGGVRSVAFSPDGRQIATGNEDGTANLWEVGPGQTLSPRGTVRAAAFSPDGRTIVTAGDDGGAGPVVLLWNAATGRPIHLLRGHTRTVNTAAFSPDGRWIATGADDGSAIVWNAATGKQHLTLKGSGEAVFAAAFSPDSQRVLTGGSDGKARIWNAAAGRLEVTFTPNANSHRGPVNAATFCPDGRRVITAGTDGTATVWDVVTGREIRTLKGHAKPIEAVAASSDGRWIVTGSQDQTAKVWEADSGKLVFTLQGHTGSVYSVAWASDSRRILTSSEDGTAKVWDAVTGRELLTLKGHVGTVHAAAWSSDGRRIVTGGADTAIVWYSY